MSGVPDDVLLRAERVRVEFGSLVAVNSLSFQLRGGDLLGLIGPNGAGKTTLLRALAGLQPMTAGRVQVLGGNVIPGAIQTVQHIGFTADNPAVYEELTVRQFLRFIARGYGLGHEEFNERVEFWLEQVWLTSKVDVKIKELSRGMHQRIGIARTLLANPYVILLDEPAAGLDPAGRVQFRQLLCSLRDMGKALIVSSHILADLNEYCTHIGIMAAGSMMQYGTVHEISNGHATERCRYTIGLAKVIDDLEQRLAGIDGIGSVEFNRDHFTVEYDNNREAAAELLRRLISHDLPVASFVQRKLDLEEAYLRTGIRQVD